MAPRGGLVGLIGGGIGIAAEYRAHRKEQKLSREASRDDRNDQNDNGAGPSTQPEPPRNLSPQPPAYETQPSRSPRGSTVMSGPPAMYDKKHIDENEDYEDEEAGNDLVHSSADEDEALWQLDEAGAVEEPPSYEQSEADGASIDALVRDVLQMNVSGRPPQFQTSPLPLPVILPQRRPGSRDRGFVRAYAPLLGECSGIDQDTFMAFLKNFQKSSLAHPGFTVVQVATGIAGFTPGVIVMAVTTAIQVVTHIGKEAHSRYRTNNFLDRMNEEMFKPAGLYAMIVQYKSDSSISSSSNSMLARFGIGAEKVDLSTNQVIAKYDRDVADNASSRSMSERWQRVRLSSNTTRGSAMMPESAPLIFPALDEAIIKDGPETFKDKTHDFKKFVAGYRDKRAQQIYARDDPNSALALPDDQMEFKSKYADPSHPMYNGGLVGLVSGGVLTRDRSSGRGGGGGGGGGGRRSGRGGLISGLVGVAMEAANKRGSQSSSSNPPAPYGGQPAPYGGQGRSYNGQYDDDDYYDNDQYDNRGTGGYGRGAVPGLGRGLGGGPGGRLGIGLGGGHGGGYGSGHSAGYDYQDQSGYDNSGRRRSDRRNRSNKNSGGRGGPILGLKKMIKSRVFYLMIVNMPSEAELKEAREAIGQIHDSN